MRVSRTAGAFGRELRQGLRRLRWSAGFAALAIGILVAGIGTNAAMVALVDALLLRPPFHVADPEQVVRSFLCECGDPECTESVEITVEACAKPIYAPGHG